MRICILTFHRAQNYGAVLQAYALQKKIEELGYTCDILDYRCEKIENSYKLFGVKSPSPKNVVSMLLHLPFNIKKEKSFAKFRKQFLRISEEIYTRQNIANSNKEYDVFIVGSDQVWNGDLTGVDRTYFLDFVKERKTKIAYAASVLLYDRHTLAVEHMPAFDKIKPDEFTHGSCSNLHTSLRGEQ